MAKSNSKEFPPVDSVRGMIGKLLSRGPVTIAQTAQALGTSARTLQRRLSEQDLLYSQLVDEVRFIKARELILQKNNIADVASQLGYGDPGSFTRAFERWTGMSPMQYRKRFYQTTRKTVAPRKSLPSN